jgi:tyrosine-protein phosphatase non-receptor type 23
LDEALSFTRDIVEGKRKNAVSENEFIYHEVVPPKDNLPKVTGHVLVKAIGFDLNDPEIAGPDIFSKLISMKVHKLSSIYR